jgi:hypothetical protein
MISADALRMIKPTSSFDYWLDKIEEQLIAAQKNNINSIEIECNTLPHHSTPESRDLIWTLRGLGFIVKRTTKDNYHGYTNVLRISW